LDGRIDHVAQLLFFADVHRECDRLTAGSDNSVRNFVSGIRADIRHYYDCAFSAEHFGAGSADAATSARDDADFILQSIHSSSRMAIAGVSRLL
jgi:hypothetical protein